ncbi:MAG: alpha/beta hydrolase [Saprospiraceae bacterium]|nr:alpha/beta hydrolase [Saprospiraceae bacterium]
MKNAASSSKTIVLVHGLFVNPASWTPWKTWFESKGYTVYTPANPGHEGTPSDLRTNPAPGLGKINFEQVVRHLASFIDTLPEKPILIGHSLGGLLVQKLLSMDKGVAGVLVDGAAPLGIITGKWSFWKASFPVINYFKGDSLFIASKAWFHYAFGNTVSREESDKIYDRIVVPESRNIARSTLKSFAKIDFTKPHVPLLFIAGEKDNIIPADLNTRNYKAYKDPNSVRNFRLFEGRSHNIIGEKGWEEVAGFAFDWIQQQV